MAEPTNVKPAVKFEPRVKIKINWKRIWGKVKQMNEVAPLGIFFVLLVSQFRDG